MINTLPFDSVVLVCSALVADMGVLGAQIGLGDESVVKSQISVVFVYPPVKSIFFVPASMLAA
jgi:hypothetical protein